MSPENHSFTLQFPLLLRPRWRILVRVIGRKAEGTNHALGSDLRPFWSLVAFYLGCGVAPSCSVRTARRSQGETPLMRYCRSIDGCNRGGRVFWNAGDACGHEFRIRR